MICKAVGDEESLLCASDARDKHVLDSICYLGHTLTVRWDVDFHDDFVAEYHELAQDVQDELLASIKVLEEFGPELGRPRVDTLNGSRHCNMKELRFNAGGGVWRFAFAFDSNRRAIVLCGDNKSGGSEKRFYRKLIDRADSRYDAHLVRVKEHKQKG